MVMGIHLQLQLEEEELETELVSSRVQYCRHRLLKKEAPTLD